MTDTGIFQSVWNQTHYDVTDKKVTSGFESLKMSVLKFSTYIITSIETHPIRLATLLLW